MTEWMGAIGRSVDIAKEKIVSKPIDKVTEKVLASFT